MKLIDLLPPAAVSVELSAKSKREALVELCDLLSRAGRLPDPGAMVKILLDREALGSTGIGGGIAIPHGKAPDIRHQVAALGLSKRGVDFDAYDDEPVHIVFLLVAPTGSAGDHLKALAKISRLLKDKFFRQALRDARTPEEALRIIREEDEF